MKKIGVMSLVIALMVLTTGIAGAVDIKDIQPVDHWMGEKITRDDMRGHIVVVEFWDTTEVLCKAARPTVDGWVKKYGREKLILLGFYFAYASRKEITEYCRKKKMGHTIYRSGQIMGVKFSELPYYAVFDHRGKLVFQGDSPGEVSKKIKRLTEIMPDPLVGEGPYKKLKSLANRIIQRKGLGKVLAELRQKIESADKAEQAEAEKLFERLDRYAENMKWKAENLKADKPLKFYESFRRIAKEFEGDKIGDECQATLDKLEKDEEFQEDLKADKKYNKILPTLEKLKPCKANKPLDVESCANCRKKNSSLVKQIISTCKKVIAKHPDTPAASKADVLLEKMGK